MTLGQALVIGGLHFYVIRILILFVLIRIFARREIFSVKLNSIDAVLISWLMVSSLVFLIFDGTNARITERFGGIYNTLGIYFFVRAVVRDFEDIVLTVKMFGIIIIPLGVLFAVEYTIGKNPFSILGGVSDFPEIRNGRIRCQGPFLHSILAGTFGATAMPLFVGLWVYNKRSRLIATGAIMAATVIVVASASSGPLLAYLISIVGLIFWSFKSHMRSIRWGIVVFLLALAAYMKAPIWFLISRLSDVTGGGGYYRSALIEAAIQHFDEWWLIGTGYTAHWMPTGLEIDPNAADMTNYYIAQGVNGGVLALILFVWLLVKCVKTTGTAVRNESRYSLVERFMVWSLGCTVLGHAVSFLSVSYFDQITIFWYLVIGMIAALLHFGAANQNNLELPTSSNSDSQIIS